MSVGPVLVVHDNPSVGGMLVAAVQAMSLPVREAASKSEALQKFRDNKPMIIVACDSIGDDRACDVFDAVKAVGGADIPFLQIGGGQDKNSLLSSLEAGVDDILAESDVKARFVSRLAFWVLSEFQGIPTDLRRRALTTLRAEDNQPDEAYLINHTKLDTELMRSVLIQIQDELETAGEAFGLRYIERLAFTARVSYLLIRNSETVADFFRFPDLLYVISQGIRSPWREQMPLFLSRFEEIAADSRFMKAAQSDLSASAVLSENLIPER